MLGKFDKYWFEYNLYLSCAVSLDSRCKVKFVEYCFSKLFAPDDAIEQVDNVLSTLCSLHDEYKSHSTSTSLIVSSSPIVSGSGMIVLMIIIFLMVEDLDNKWGDRTLIYNWGSWLFS